MTTTCQPCEMAAETDIVPETTDSKSAEWSGPIGIENQKTGDGRFIEPNALRWDTLPVPLRWAMQDFGAHDGAYVVGKIEAIERLTYDEANERLASTGRDLLPESFEDAIIIWGSGVHDLGSEYGREAFRQVDEGLTPGISMDLDDIVIREEDGEDNFSITDGRVRAATQVAIPAFEGARISTSKGSREVFDAAERLEDLSVLSDDEDVFNWVDEVGGLPPYIKRIEKHLEKKGMAESHAIATAVNVVKKMCATGDLNFPGAQEVNAGSRAEACAAVAEWEEKKARAKAEAAETEGFVPNGRTQVGTAEHYLRVPEDLVASANGWTPPREWFEDPRLDGPTGLTVTDDGRVYGHIALWGTCHVANPQGKQVCTQPPRSPSGYANFHLGVTVTDAGPLATGKITMNTLHAGQRLSMVDTLHHYEHTGTVGAHVRAGEDAYGIWLAGAALPDVDLVALRAAPISGDWRSPSGMLDMVAALSVNVPGFPVPRAQALIAGGAVQSLVASGMVQVEERTEALEGMMTDDTVMALRDRLRALDRKEKADALATRVARLAMLEKVRRVAKSFAYNEDQWRVPKGNPEGGRWVDMPDAALGDLEALLMDAADNGSIPEDAAPEIGDTLNEAMDAAANSSAALRELDGDKAIGYATQADDALSKLEAQLQDLAEGDALDADTAGHIGDVLESARAGVARVKDSDLSLLGDEGIGGEAPEGDIGGEDETVVGDVPEGIDPTTLPQATQDALGLDEMENETVSESSRWPGMYEVHYTDPDTGETSLVNVADAEGNVAGDASGGGYVIYDADGGASGSYGNVEEAADALADRNKGAEAIWEGFEEQYIKTADPDSDENPDSLREEYDRLIESGVPPEDAIEQVSQRVTRNRHDAANAPTAPKAPAGSEQQQAGTRALETASLLNATIEDVAEGEGFDATEAEQVGDALNNFRVELEVLNERIQDGNYNAADLAAVQAALSQLEGVLMSVADGPGLSDEQANQIGVSLDDMFASVGELAGLLQGSSEPPPFATRKYVRQWLGRRGIRLGVFA